MPLASGARLGPYEIVSLIGKGGMGEVYRARDRKLDRDVAIKVLPDELASDSERIARFEREARLLASLNHPNIASIHGFEESDGAKALVLELVEGQTLAERIEQGAVPLEEALAIAKQIAEALEAGHEASVIHRDLKPQNVKLRDDGTVKVLDYGLAKAFQGEPAGADPELSHSPTLTRQGTQIGVILGTAAYMSPEQAKGKPVDKRTDIWAFGAVLYEMLTGERAFPGEDVSETLAAVIKSDPDWSHLPGSTPSWLRKLLHRCLQKDRSKRLRDIGDALLDWGPSSEDTRGPERRVSGPAYLLAASAVLVAGVLGWTLKPSAPGVEATSVSRLSINLPREQELSYGVALQGRPFAISPDGRTIVYVAAEAGEIKLYVRALDALRAEPIPSTAGASSPFFSPDGEWIGYFAKDRLWKVSLANRLAIALSDADGEPVGGSWLETNEIVFAAGRNNGLFRVSADGGEPSALTTVNASRNELGHLWPFALGRRVLFTVRRDVGFDFAVAAYDLDSGESRVVVEGARFVIGAPSGYLVYGVTEARGDGGDSSNVYAASFDAELGAVTGPAVGLPLNAYSSPGGGAYFVAVSGMGGLVYTTAPLSQIGWADRGGAFEPLADLGWSDWYHIRLSPDGKRLAFTNRIYDLERGTMQTPSAEGTHGGFPTWRPGTDDDELAVFTLIDGLEQLALVDAGGDRAPVRLLESTRSQVPNAWSSRDGELLYTEQFHPETGYDLWILRPDGTTAPYLVTDASERNGRFSPDGSFVAYESDESGRYEIYVRDYPEAERRWTISSSGGRDALWSPTGRELFYRNQGFLMRVEVTLEPRFSPSPPAVLLEAPMALGQATYDITPDGKRFLMLRGDPADLRELHVVLNWTEELNRLVPAGE